MNPQTGIKLVEINELTNQRIDLMQAKMDALGFAVLVLVIVVTVLVALVLPLMASQRKG